MRKLIYSVGVFMFLFVLSTAFYNSYQVSQLRAQVRNLESEQEEYPAEQEPVLSVDTKTAQQGYYLREEDGLVYVYRGDKVTLYEHTSIPVSSLPENLQKEIQEGKHLGSEIELYNFLENYSS